MDSIVEPNSGVHVPSPKEVLFLALSEKPKHSVYFLFLSASDLFVLITKLYAQSLPLTNIRNLVRILRCHLSFTPWLWTRSDRSSVHVEEFLSSTVTLSLTLQIPEGNILSSLLSCVFVFLALDKSFYWLRNRSKSRAARSHDFAEKQCKRLGKLPKMAGKTIMIFSTSEKFCMRPLIGQTIFFTSEKNCMTNQIVSWQWRRIFS